MNSDKTDNITHSTAPSLLPDALDHCEPHPAGLLHGSDCRRSGRPCGSTLLDSSYWGLLPTWWLCLRLLHLHLCMVLQVRKLGFIFLFRKVFNISVEKVQDFYFLTRFFFFIRKQLLNEGGGSFAPKTFNM